jgi:hypothetical protein
MVNNNNTNDGIVGTILSTTAAVVSNLDTVETTVRILAGIVAIVAVIATTIYYVKKINGLK